MKTQRAAKFVLCLIPQCFFAKILLRPCGKSTIIILKSFLKSVHQPRLIFQDETE